MARKRRQKRKQKAWRAERKSILSRYEDLFRSPVLLKKVERAYGPKKWSPVRMERLEDYQRARVRKRIRRIRRIQPRVYWHDRVYKFGVTMERIRHPIICGRRQVKREVLFALKQVGKGRGGPKERKMTEDSKVRC